MLLCLFQMTIPFLFAFVVPRIVLSTFVDEQTGLGQVGEFPRVVFVYQVSQESNYQGGVIYFA